MNYVVKLSFSLKHWFNYLSIYDLTHCAWIQPRSKSRKWHSSQEFFTIGLKPSGSAACFFAPRSTGSDSSIFLMLTCEELIHQFGCTLCYLGVTVIHHNGSDTKEQQQIHIHHDKMLYLWFVYMHKSAEQPSLASTQNSFIWIESACDHAQKDWLLIKRPGDTEPPS